MYVWFDVYLVEFVIEWDFGEGIVSWISGVDVYDVGGFVVVCYGFDFGIGGVV